MTTRPTDPPAEPAEDVLLWRLGPDSSAGDWDTSGDVPTLTVQAAEPGAALPVRHPGVLDAFGGLTGHRLRIGFAVRTAVAATLRLRCSADRGPCPDLEIVLDDVHRGVFHPTVLREDRHHSTEPGPVAGLVDLQITLPAEWLVAGQHVLTITTVLDAASALGEDRGHDHTPLVRPVETLPPARETYRDWFGSYLRWHSLSLTADDPGTATEVPGPVATLRATPFWVRTDAGEAELVDCELSWPAGTPVPPPVQLEWEGTTRTAPPVPADRDFGSFRWRFAAPDLDGPTAVRVRVGSRVEEQPVSPARRWTLHLVPHVHLDLGFTDTQGKVLELHCRNIDRALDLFDEDPGFRFAVDGSVVVAHYLATRTAERGERLRRAVAAGRLGVNAFHSNFLSGVLSLPELQRSTDLALTLPVSGATGLRYANLTDVPFGNRSIPAVLADRGIEGFVTMTNHGRAATGTSDQVHLRSPLRWRAPDGSEVLAHVADQYSQLRFVAADPQSVAGATDGLARLLQRYERPDHLPTDLPLVGTHADNEDLADGDTGFVDRWNAVFAWPRLRVSTFDEYLAAVRPLTDRLPVWEAETGSFWEDGFGSVAAEAASYRRTQALLPATETLGALVARASDGLRVHRAELDRAWEGLAIAAEHTFTWSRATSHPHADAVQDQLDWMRRHLFDARRIAVNEMRRHLAQLAELADLSGPGVLAWNPHAWTAELETEVELDAGVELLGPDGPAPTEVLADCDGRQRRRVGLGPMPAHSWRFLPATGSVATRPGGGGAAESGERARTPGDFIAPAAGQPVRTPTWSLRLDAASGLPVDLVHRPTGRHLLDPGTGRRLGQLLRTGPRPFEEAVTGSRDGDTHRHRRMDQPSTLGMDSGSGPAAAARPMTIESPELRLVGVRPTHDGARLRWEGGGVGVDEVRLELLLRDDDSCDLTVSFDKRRCLDAEAVYVAFPFAATEPTLRHDRPLGWVCPARDHGPGAANEWTALSSTVSVDSAEGEIWWTALDTPLFTVGDVVRGTWSSEFPVAAQSHLYAYAMNNYWPCNTPPEQPGPVSFSFRFGVSAGFDPVASTRRGRTARLSAPSVELLPLDRFRAGQPVEPSSGDLALLPDDLGLDQLLQTLPDDRLELTLVNLGPDPVTPDPNEGSSVGDGSGPPGFGLRRVVLPGPSAR